ncbi:MAG: DUF1761 domain-containing protein [Bacteroidota bacterium]
MNVLILLAAAVIPMIIGAIWYNPKVLGSAWMAAAGVREEQLQEGNILVIFGLAFLFSFFLAFALFGDVVHQSSLYSLFVTQPEFEQEGSEMKAYFDNFMEQYGYLHRSFGHGIIHGIESAIIYALPFIGIIALFERRGWKYILIHFGYWLLSLALMGGVICQYA